VKNKEFLKYIICQFSTKNNKIKYELVVSYYLKLN